jgi:hypothetical protein
MDPYATGHAAYSPGVEGVEAEVVPWPWYSSGANTCEGGGTNLVSLGIP